MEQVQEKKSFFHGMKALMVVFISLSALKWSMVGLDHLGVITLA